ncbi:MAG: TIGR01777 family protein [Pseudopedobacter saltans]|uniref:TIGR01777 family protein n=1 Tax=Pseudopedobacter saltans TaxID=151895 RepID=A0A2W5EQZ3_9SPHI|nr:MAG: TIGR01777 family protein [Pseudopedobacter saltans]
MKEIVLITGANGLVAKHLAQRLTVQYDVRLLTRYPNKVNEYKWDVTTKTIDPKALENVSHVIHLAGANIFEKRWTAKRKQEIISSRVDSAHLILDALKQKQQKIKTFVSASAIGFYGAVTTDTIFTENDAKGDDFLSDVVDLWENAANNFDIQNMASRVVKIRTAVVFADKNSALQKMEQPIKNYIGATLGSGKQYMPWIHIDDLCSIYECALQDSNMVGVYNAVAPQHITNKELTQLIAKKLKKPLWLPPVPSLILRLAFGESVCMLLEGSRVSCEKLQKEGFHFQYNDIETFA